MIRNEYISIFGERVDTMSPLLGIGIPPCICSRMRKVLLLASVLPSSLEVPGETFTARMATKPARERKKGWSWRTSKQADGADGRSRRTEQPSLARRGYRNVISYSFNRMS